mmetsp:Transcript_28015/g.54468  ORF Transcript_28015/g.54468 Transcript_28015/m.54468 type:complete len:230 (-) Transcript_28015:310-999(-)
MHQLDEAQGRVHQHGRHVVHAAGGPVQAREESPESLRGLEGSRITQNPRDDLCCVRLHTWDELSPDKSVHERAERRALRVRLLVNHRVGFVDKGHHPAIARSHVIRGGLDPELFLVVFFLLGVFLGARARGAAAAAGEGGDGGHRRQLEAEVEAELLVSVVLPHSRRERGALLPLELARARGDLPVLAQHALQLHLHGLPDEPSVVLVLIVGRTARFLLRRFSRFLAAT